MPAHTHDGIDWAARLADLRHADTANAAALRAVADRLIESLPAPHPTVLDVGCGAGGMSAALAEALVGRAARATTGTTDHVATPTSPTPTSPAIAENDAASTLPTVPAPDAPAPDSDEATPAPNGGALTPDSVAPTPDRSAEAAANADAGPTNSASANPAPTDHNAASSADLHLPRRPAGTAGRPGAAPTDSTSVAATPTAARAATTARDATSTSGLRTASPTSAPADPTAPAGHPAAPANHAGAHPGNVPAGGTLVLVDAVPELLAAAEQAAVTAGGVGDTVTVRTVRADIADPGSFAGLPPADLVWASGVVHHLPDQRAAVRTLVELLAPGGCLAVAEGGLSMRCLPWDVGVGEPGLQDRLIAAHGTWFERMRAEIPDAVRMPVGWNRVLAEAGLSGVTAFTYLVDLPAPLGESERAAVVNWLQWMAQETVDLMSPDDVAALHRLLDPADPAYVGRRDDVFVLKASTVHLGWAGPPHVGWAGPPHLGDAGSPHPAGSPRPGWGGPPVAGAGRFSG